MNGQIGALAIFLAIVRPTDWLTNLRTDGRTDDKWTNWLIGLLCLLSDQLNCWQTDGRFSDRQIGTLAFCLLTGWSTEFLTGWPTQQLIAYLTEKQSFTFCSLNMIYPYYGVVQDFLRMYWLITIPAGVEGTSFVLGIFVESRWWRQEEREARSIRLRASPAQLAQ